MIQQIFFPQAIHECQIPFIAFFLIRVVNFSVLIGIDAFVVHPPEAEEKHAKIIQFYRSQRNLILLAIAIRVFFFDTLEIRIQFFRGLRLFYVKCL
ncbi:hypothetical protein D3C74_403320 [compost metagenome]